MLTKAEGRSSRHDLIDDIVETSSPLLNRKSSALIDGTKILPNRNYSSYSNIPLLFNKSKFEQTDNLTSEVRDRRHLTLPRSNSSLLLMSNDDRRKEIDLIIKHLYDGKLLTPNNDDRPASEVSEPSIHMLHKASIATTIHKNHEETKNHIDLLPVDGDITLLQRELQEKELDIIHLHKEIQELQLENKLLKSKVPTVYSNGYSSNNSEIESLRREKDIIQNELRTSQELIAKYQHQQHHNVIAARSNKIDEIILHQKEGLENKLKTYEKQLRTLTNENEKLKQHFHQTERIIAQAKRDNEELQQKVVEAKKRNDELFYQEFNALRNDLKMVKHRNNELYEENLRFQHAWRSDQTSSKPDSKHLKVQRSESPNLSEASDSTNYLTTINVDRYNTHPTKRSSISDGNNHHRTSRYNSLVSQEDIHRNHLSKSLDRNLNIRSAKTKHTFEWNEDNTQINDDINNYDDDDHQTTDGIKTSSSAYFSHPVHRHEHSRRIINNDTNNQQDDIDRRQQRKSTETISTRRPYAPLTISDIRLNDLIKFSRPGGKITKGTVKYIGTLPGKTDQYLGLELDDEDSKHDGVYQDQRLFQCKPNKGVFVAFNKVIMAWGGK